MEDRIDILFEEWRLLGAPVLVENIKPVKLRPITMIIAESTKYCRFSSRLTWILLGWACKNLDKIDVEKLLNQTKEIGDLTVLGVICEAIKAKSHTSELETIINQCPKSEKTEIFFHKIASNKLATMIVEKEALPLFKKWNYLSAELEYIGL